MRPEADTTLWELDPGNNLGTATLAVGTTAGLTGAPARSRPVFRFNISTIPANAVVTSARLSFRVTKVPSGAIPSTHRLHRLAVSWNEGTKGGNTGSAAGPTEATWTSRGTGAGWSSAGAQAPGDFASDASASALMAGLGVYNFNSTAALVADVQAWIKDPALNFGWIMISGAEATPRSAKRLGSRESGANAPSLTIEYVAVTTGTPPVIEVQPRNLATFPGLPANLTVTAKGTDPLTFQWLKNGVPISGASEAKLTLPKLSPVDAANYSVNVSNGSGTTTSQNAQLSLLPLPALEFLNIESGKAQLRFAAAPGHRYQVEFASGLPSPWNVLTQLVGDAAIPLALVSDEIAANLQRFYRISITAEP